MILSAHASPVHLVVLILAGKDDFPSVAVVALVPTMERTEGEDAIQAQGRGGHADVGTPHCCPVSQFFGDHCLCGGM